MKTLLDTPEIEWRYSYGVMWDDEADEPHVEYDTLPEARAVAEIMGGYLLVKRVAVAAWEPLEAEALEDACPNCDGRKCMDCVLRYWHEACRDDCPDCCQ